MIRCKLGWHDYTWKRESYRVRIVDYVHDLWHPPRYSMRMGQVGTCSRCGHTKFKSL